MGRIKKMRGEFKLCAGCGYGMVWLLGMVGYEQKNFDSKPLICSASDFAFKIL